MMNPHRPRSRNGQLLIGALLLLPGPLACNGAIGSDSSDGGASGGSWVGSGGSVGVGGIAATGGASTGGATNGTGGIPGNSACPGEIQDAYRGTPATAPGTVEAEDFDVEGYEDSTLQRSSLALILPSPARPQG